MQKTGTLILTDVDPARLPAIVVKQIRLPDETLMKDARYVERAASVADIYGADDLTERVVLVGFEGNNYVIGFSLLRYGDNWMIKDQTSPFADINPNGAPQQISEEAFEQLVTGD